MIVSKCPLRVSLVGGASDLSSFLEKNERGSVISFPCSLNTYISVHENNRNRFIINYSASEESSCYDTIKNDVARVALQHFKPSRFLTISFNSDIFSVGSGLAASSSYMIALIKAMCAYTGSNMSDFDICKLALDLERQFNPLTGQQDTYGCGMMDFKKIDFHLTKDPSFQYLPSTFLENFDMYLLYTGKLRKSTSVLSNVDTKKIKNVVEYVDHMEGHIRKGDVEGFCSVLSEGWRIKKSSSPMIISSEKLAEIDTVLSRNNNVKAHKLCGAGGGGHFVFFTKPGSKINFLGKLKKWCMPIKLTKDGLKSVVI